MFKAYDHDSKKWLKHFFIRSEDGAVFERIPYFKIVPKEPLRLANATVCRPLNTFDVNKKPLYEFDIVEYHENGAKGLYTIIFDGEKWRLDNFSWGAYRWHKMKKVGNKLEE